MVPPYFAACAASLRRSNKRLIGNGITRRFLFPAIRRPRRFQNLSSEATSASPSPNRSCSHEPVSLSVVGNVLLFFHAFLILNMDIIYRRPRTLSSLIFRAVSVNHMIVFISTFQTDRAVSSFQLCTPHTLYLHE